LHAALATSDSSANQFVVLIQQFKKQIAMVTAQSKTYSDTKNGFSITLPAGWKKLKSSTDTLFTAQPTKNNLVQWTMSSTKYKTQKQANQANTTLTKKPQDFGNLLLAALQNGFPTGSCVLNSAKKKTISSYTGARVNIDCTMDTTQYTFSIFAFVRKLRYYSVMYITPTTEFTQYLKQLDSITKSLKFTK
jgi:hypothetical protein